MSLPISLRGYHWPQTVLEATPSDGIYYLALNMTSACNYRCPYCFVGLANLKPSRTSFMLMKNSPDRSGSRLWGQGRGHAGSRRASSRSGFLEHPRRSESSRPLGGGLYQRLFLDREKILRLKQAGISLYLKVDSFDQKIYEEMVGKKGVFARVRSNLTCSLNTFMNR